MYFVRLEQFPKVKKVNRDNYKSEEKSRPSRLQQVKIRLNTEKSPGDLRRLPVTKIPVKYHQPT